MRRTLLLALPLGLTACTISTGPGPGALLLTNKQSPPSRVEAVVAASPDCTALPGGASSFVLPPDATRIIDAPPGAAVCWRALTTPPAPGWTRDFLAPGRILDSRL